MDSPKEEQHRRTHIEEDIGAFADELQNRSLRM